MVAKKGGPTIVHAHLKALAAAAPKDLEARNTKRGQGRMKVTEKRKERDEEEENPFDTVQGLMSEKEETK